MYNNDAHCRNTKESPKRQFLLSFGPKYTCCRCHITTTPTTSTPPPFHLFNYHPSTSPPLRSPPTTSNDLQTMTTHHFVASSMTTLNLSPPLRPPPTTSNNLQTTTTHHLF